MQINIFPYIHFTAFIIYVFLAVYILWKNPKSLLNRLFFFLFAIFSVWSFGFIFIHNHDVTKEQATFFMNVSSIGWIWSTVLFLWLILVQIRAKVKIWLVVVLTAIPSLVFFIWQWFDYLIVDYVKMYYGWSLVYNFSWIFYAWVFYYSLISFLLIALLILYIIRESNKTYRIQSIVILVCSSISLSVGTFIDVILPSLDIRVIPDVSDLVALIWVIGVLYAINRYKFLLITPATAAQNIISCMSNALVIINYGGKILSINQAAENMLNCRSSDLKNRPAEVIFENGENFKEIIEKAFLGENLVNKSTNLKTFDNKKNIPVIFSSSALKDEKGNLLGMIFVAKDITEIKAFQEELRHKSTLLEKQVLQLKLSEEALRFLLADYGEEKKHIDAERKKTALIISSITDPILFIDNQKRIALHNPSAKQMLGLKDNFEDFVIESKKEPLLEDLKKIISVPFQGKKIETKNGYFEEVSLKYLGEEKTFKVITSAVIDKSDKNQGVIKVFYDFTREKVLERLKSEFISIAAHKLRTPLSAIKWVIKMIIDGDAGKLNKEQYDLLNKAYKSNERIIELVNNLLDVSKIEEGKFDYSFKKENFNLVFSVFKDYADTLAEKNRINLSYETMENFPEVFMDKNRIILVMQNLIDNAIKYTPPFGKIITKVNMKDGFLNVSVKDNGVGIPDKDKQKIFSKFFRASNVIRMQTEGSGLGLFIVKNVIEKHNGKVAIDSQEGRGTEVSFSLPINKI